MSTLKGNLVFGQSGGPTSVINASAAGVFLEALKHTDVIEKVYGAAHGIVGILNEDLIDINQEDPEELKLLRTTPSSAMGSVRYKLADPSEDESDYRRLLEVFKLYNIRYFLYNGGNDSMDTCNKISKYMQQSGWEMRVMGVPKTIDNDLYGTDHCPGFASAAKYLATSTMEVYQDATVYNTSQITILEVMGRNAGWLTASTALANLKGAGPDLVYLPELPINFEDIREDVANVFRNKNKVIIAISEGVKTQEGKYLPELVGEVDVDAFGHKQMGGTGEVLADFLRDHFDTKIRSIEFSLLQRCAAHLASQTDIDEAFEAGSLAVRKAVEGMTDYMIGFERAEGKNYKCEYILIPLEKVANTEKKFPREWINEEGNGILPEFYDYVLPLIQGETELVKEDGLPRFANLKKIKVKH